MNFIWRLTMLKCVNLFWEVLHSWVNHWILKTLGGSESHFVLLALLPCFKNLSSCPKFAFRIFYGSINFWWILFNNENENFVRRHTARPGLHLRFSFSTKCFIYQGKQTISFKNFLPRPTKEIKRIQITSREMYPEDI